VDGLFWVNVFSRWVHVVSAVVAVGGLVFLAGALLPGAVPGSSMLGGALQRFKRLFHMAMGLLLLTGIYNLVVVVPKANALGAMKSTYHSVLGTKILLALCVFAAAFMWQAEAGRDLSAALTRKRTLLVTLVLAGLVLLLSAVLRRVWDLDPRLALP
jgi:putative copper export protein